MFRWMIFLQNLCFFEDESDSNTLSGWIAEKIEKIPEVGDVYNYDKVKIKVVAVEKHRADVAEVYLN